MHQFDVGSNSKALDGAIKQMRSVAPNSSIMLFSADEEEGKLVVLSSVSDEDLKKGLKASEWVQQISTVINGKGGGKELSAQATGSSVKSVTEAMDIARKFAEMKVNGG